MVPTSFSSTIVVDFDEFLNWIILANIIAWPIGWYFMSQWLQGFAYKTSIDVWVFVSAMFFMTIIAIFSVSYQAIKAANSDPINSLKYE